MARIKGAVMKSNKKAFGFLRISSDRQKDNTSHETQLDVIQRYCSEAGLELVGVEAIKESAKDADARIQYKAAKEQADKRGCRHYVFYMYDRETRNLTDNEENEGRVKRGELTLHYAKEGKAVDKNSPPSDFFMRDVHATLNKHYSRLIGSKVRDANRAAAERGRYPYNRLPLGYAYEAARDAEGNQLKNGKIIVLDPNPLAQKQVLREYELRAEGFSLAQIRERIIQEGLIPPSATKRYKRSTIEGRLKNKFYRGFFDVDGIQYEGTHPLFIPSSTLAAVDASFTVKRFQRRQAEGQGVFSGGWLRCADKNCGCHIVYDPKDKEIKSTGKKKKYHYYHCTNGRRVHGSLAGRTVKEEQIWAEFGRAVGQISIGPKLAGDIAAALNKTHDKAKNARRNEIKAYEDALASLEKKEDKVRDLVISETFDQTDFRREMEKIQKERERYTDLLKQAQTDITGAYLETAESVLELATNAKSLWLSRPSHERKEFLDQILSNPVLDGLTIRYEWRKPFGSLAEMAQKEDWLPGTDSNRRQGG